MVRFTEKEIALLKQIFIKWNNRQIAYKADDEFKIILNKYTAAYDQGVAYCNGPNKNFLSFITELYELALLFKTLEDEHLIIFVSHDNSSFFPVSCKGANFQYVSNVSKLKLDSQLAAVIDKCFTHNIIYSSTLKELDKNNYKSYELQLLESSKEQNTTATNSISAIQEQTSKVGDLLEQAKLQTEETKKQTQLSVNALDEAKKQTKEAAAQSFEARKQTQQAFLQTRQALKQTEEAKEQTHQALAQTEQAQIQTEQARKQSSQALMQTQEALKQTRQAKKQTSEAKKQTFIAQFGLWFAAIACFCSMIGMYATLGSMKEEADNLREIVAQTDSLLLENKTDSVKMPNNH